MRGGSRVCQILTVIPLFSLDGGEFLVGDITGQGTIRERDRERETERKRERVREGESERGSQQVAAGRGGPGTTPYKDTRVCCFVVCSESTSLCCAG